MKKGGSLIEVLITTALIGIIITYEVWIFARYVEVNKKSLRQQETERYVEEAFDFISDQIENCRYVYIEEDCLILEMPQDEGKNCIELRPTNNLVIKYGNKAVTIADNIQSFNVLAHGKVLYISITDIYGKKYEKCYEIKFQK